MSENIRIPERMEFDFAYAAGKAGSAFFRALRDEGKILGSYSAETGRTMVPPRMFCEESLAETRLVEVSTSGEVVTFTISYINTDATRAQTPWVLAIIRLDATDGGFVTKIINIRPEAVHIGMRVRAVIKPRPERQGRMDDIVGFEPLARGDA